MRRSACSAALAAFAVGLSACASAPKFLADDFREHQPRTVYVMSPRNDTLQSFESEVVAAFEEGLRERGYVVGGAESDASLRPAMLAWSSDYAGAPFPYETYIALEADLIDHRSGLVLWHDQRDGGEKLRSESSLVGSLIDAAVDQVFPPGPHAPVALAQELIDKMMETLPRRE